MTNPAGMRSELSKSIQPTIPPTTADAETHRIPRYHEGGNRLNQRIDSHMAAKCQHRPNEDYPGPVGLDTG